MGPSTPKARRVKPFKHDCSVTSQNYFIMLKNSSQKFNSNQIFHKLCRFLYLLLVVEQILTSCSYRHQLKISESSINSLLWQPVQAQQQFVDSSTLKPSIILILPQKLRASTNSIIQDETDQQQPANKLEQFVALVNNAQNEREDQLLREQYKKLTVQVRDASSPITGQLFYEHVFDYFPPNSNHLLIPINLDQISPAQERNSFSKPSKHKLSYHHFHQREQSSKPSYDGLLGDEASDIAPTTVNHYQRLIISVRPYQLDSGFGSENIEFVSSGPILVEPVASSDGQHSFAVVQTDKPIYKPQDKVRIRSLIVNENLRPILKDEFKLQIKSPQKLVVEEIRFPRAQDSINNRSRQQVGQQSEKLFFDHLFEFPPEPMLGMWSVHLIHSDPMASDATNFEVREYVLPTFEIEFNSPKYILPTTENITGSITARYHYGKPVKGEVQFKFGYREFPTSLTKFVGRTQMKRIDPSTGRGEYNFSSKKFKDELWFPAISKYRFVVEATVVEMSTGHRETATDTVCTFIITPYTVLFEDSMGDFKPGLSQQLTVQLIDAETRQPGPAGARLIAHYHDQNGTPLGPHTQTVHNKPVDFRDQLDSEAITDPLGQATFKIGPVRDEVSLIRVRLRLSNTTGPVSVSNDHNSSESILSLPIMGQHDLLKHESQNGWVSLMNKSVTHLNVGDQFISDLLIREAVVIPHKIFYLILTRNRIIALDVLNSEGLISFKITEAMIPSIRIVLFALTQDSIGLLSDSMRISIANDMSCGLNLKYESNANPSIPSNTFKPNDAGKLLIGARQGDSISLIGVDSAVYSLYNRTRFNSLRVIQRIKRLDAGCGFGGGRDTYDVFHNAGLMIFRDVTGFGARDTQALPGGSFCRTLHNQAKNLDDIQMSHMNKANFNLRRSHSSFARSYHPRSKREVDVDTVVSRYKNSLHRSCCYLGTLEDIPQRRDCSIRRRIVEKYMFEGQYKECPSVYFDCCQAVFEMQLASAGLMPRSQEPIVRPRIIKTVQVRQENDPAPQHNIGLLDKIEAETLVRNDFRETWLFDIVTVDDPSGKASKDITLPHSITTWSVSAMALNLERPMCVMSKPLNLVTFQDIFIQLAMPYKVVQGEQIDLVTTVYNYDSQPHDVAVYMYGLDDVCSEAEPGERSERKRIRVERHSMQTVLFPMIPLKARNYNIKIVAATLKTNSSDIIERQLNVVPRGRPVTDEITFSLDPMNHQRRNKRAIQTGNLVDEIDSSRGLQHSKVRLIPTRDSEYIVPQTQECIVSAIADKFGHTVQTTMLDVENLIRLPHGCGEQVMIYLGPTLYTTRYLSSLNKLSGDMRWRSIRYIQSGYKRILNFRKENGSFSAFTKRDSSIWLTAFVAKLLCQTERTPFVAEEVHVDRTVINYALRWLIDIQNESTGTWTEMNPVYHREMLGGVLKENALTAFVVLALNECAHHSPDLVDEIKSEASSASEPMPSIHAASAETNGVDKLRKATQAAEEALILDSFKAVREKNPYVLALTAYALSYSRPRDAAQVLNDLILLANRLQSSNQLYWRGEYDIETAAYALQALIELAPILASSATTSSGKLSWQPGADAVSIANWLSSRRSYTGAFESTQDTVVALEALSKFAQLQSTPNGNALVPQSSESGPNLICNMTINNRSRRSIEFHKENAQILQTFKLDSFDLDPFNTEELDILTSGSGLGTMSVRLKYHVFQDEDKLCGFDIESSIEEWKPKILPPTRDQQSNDDGEGYKLNESNDDDYFKPFEPFQPMLSELSGLNSNNLQETSDLSLRLAPVSRRSVLRLKRFTSNSSTTSDESWTSRVVSNLRSRLTGWVTSRPTGNTSTSTIATASIMPTPSRQTHISSHKPDSPKRTGNSRRSTNSPAPIGSKKPGGIEIDTHVNNLSLELDFNPRNTSLARSNSTQRQVSFTDSGQRLILLLSIRVSYLSSFKNSEMAIVEVGILSGFKPNRLDLEEIINDKEIPASKYEMSADQSIVNIYMDYIPYSGPTILRFRLVRDSLVYNLQTGYIRVYEYYQPKHSCSSYYTASRVSDLIQTRCDSSGLVCECVAKSLCPVSNKLRDLSELHQFNATSAHDQLVNLVCSNRFDLVSIVRLANVRHFEISKMFKLTVTINRDIKGNLTKIVEAQRRQKSQWLNNVSEPLPLAHQTTSDDDTVVVEDSENRPLDQLTLTIDSNCVRSDQLLLHLAHPNQWRHGDKVMVLFAKFENIRRHQFKIAPKATFQRQNPGPLMGPRPKPNILSRVGDSKPNENQQPSSSIENLFDNTQQLQYSLSLSLDRNTILHHISYQTNVAPRDAINKLIMGLDAKKKYERWACPA